MSSTYDNTVFDFDLDFLNQPPPNNAEPDLQARCDRLRKSVIFFKKRVKVIDHYVTVAKAAKNEITELRITETQLKNQCRQHHVEIGNFIEKVTRLENEVQAAEARERQKNETISELENKIVATQKVYAQYKVLVEEHKLEPCRNKKVKSGVTNNAKNTLIEKEVETLRKNNAKFLNLDKVNEKLRKENARIPILQQEIENLRKNIAFVSKSEKVNDHNEIARIELLEKEIATLCKENDKISKFENEIEVLHKENAEIPKLEREMVNLQKENTKIPKLEKEIESLQKENAKIPMLEKEIESLQKENAKIPKLMKEIENLHKENVKFTKLGSEKETICKLNIKISNLVKDNEILRIKNTDIETENKALRKKIDNIPTKGVQLINLTSTTKENGKVRTKHNKLTRKYKSLPEKQGEKSDDSEAENYIFENPLLLPISNDAIDKKSLIAGKDIAVPREFDTEHSPENLVNYCTSDGDNIENEGNSKDTTMSGSPILLKEIETPTIIIVDHNENQNICELKSVSHRKSHSTNDEREVSNSVDTSDNIRPKQRTQEKECLEINNSLRCENHTELELENIFRTMKLDYNAISPIPRTPTNVDSTSSPSEKFDRCSSLCYKTIDFMQTLIRMAVSQGRDRNKVNINECDKMIACFESILKSEQILTETNPEHCVLNTNSNLEISDSILGRDDNNLGTILNPESSKTSSQKETDISQNKKCGKRLSQNASLLQEENQNHMFCNDTKSVTISNPSPPDKGTHINRDKQVEKGLPQCLPMSMDEYQLNNHSVSEELAIDDAISEDTDSDGSSRDIVEVNQPPIKKKGKNKKKTKLEKLKKKLEPKYKIRMEKTPPENMRVKPKQLLPIKRKVTENDTSASLNRKDIYEKAVKFMAQLNSQQSAKQAETSPKHTKDLHKPQRHTVCLEKDIESSVDNQVLQNCSISTRSKRKISELFEPCSVLLIKDTLLLSPRKSENSTTHRAKEDNNSSTLRSKEDYNSTIHRAKEDSNINNSTTHKVKEDIKSSDELPLRKRLRRSSDNPLNIFSKNAKGVKNSTTDRSKDVMNSTPHRAKEDIISTTHNVKENIESSDELPLRKRLRRTSDKPLNIFSSNAKEDKNFTTDKENEDKNSTMNRAKQDNISTTHKVKEDTEPSNELPLRKRLRRSSDKPLNIFSMKTKENNNSTTDISKKDKNCTTHRAKEDNISTTQEKEDVEPSNELPLRKRLSRSSNEPHVQCKRVLRSATVHTKLCTENNNELSKSKGKSRRKSIKGPRKNISATEMNDESTLHNSNVVSYQDLDLFSEDIQHENKISETLRCSSDKPLNNFSINAKDDNNSTKEDNICTTHKVKEDIKPSDELPLQKGRRRCSNEPLIQYQRVLRSATVHKKLCAEDGNELSKSTGESIRKSIMVPSENESATLINNESALYNSNVVSYEDLGLFSEDIQLEKKMSETLRRSSDKSLTNFSTNAKEDNNSTIDKAKEDIISTTHKVKEGIKPSDELPLQQGRRRSSNEPPIQYKGVLRSATVLTKLCAEDNIELPKLKGKSSMKSITGPSENESATQINNESTLNNSNVVSYEDLDVFSEDKQLENKIRAPVMEVDTNASDCDPKDSILCYMIKKYGVETVTRMEKRIPGKVVTKICEKIERNVTIIVQNHCSKKAKDNLVADLRKFNPKHFIAGLMQFLVKPERKLELFGKVRGYSAPAMTKTEQILLDVIAQLKNHWPSVDIVDAVLCSIEFTLFKLNRTPEFDVIESISHFYAVLCRFVRAQSRLRLFILDAMYCIQFKSVPLIKQCLEVWMSLIPLSHMGMAKTPMVTCLVYLLHFYKCDDRFNRVQELRKILREQYFYKITNWSETKILEMFKNSITGLRDISIEKKMLRLALIILAKRRGPHWCQLHIVKNLLQPLIEKKNVPNNVKQFCVSVIGPLMKPYPADMKIHCEIAINQLLDILDDNPTPEMEEAAITSMMVINRHDQHSLNKMLLSRKMKPMSSALEKTIRDYVKVRPLKVWETHLATFALELENHYYYD